MSPTRTLLFFLLLSIVGLGLLPELEVDLQPQSRAPVLQLHFSLLHATPDVVEQQATAPLENALSGLRGIKHIRSTSRYHGGEITLEFKEGTDLAFQRLEVAGILRQLYPKLPRRMSYPTVTQSAENQSKEKQPLLAWSVASPLPSHETRRILDEQLRPALSGIEGLKELKIYGAYPQEVFVEYNAQKLKVYGLNYAKILSHIQQKAQNTSIGWVSPTRQERLVLHSPSQLKSLDDLRNLVLDSLGTNLIRLGDVTKISLREHQPQQVFRINGKQAITLSAYAEENSNRLRLAEELTKQLETFKVTQKTNLEFFKGYDDTEFLREELDKTYRRAGLAVAVLLLFLVLAKQNIRYLLVISVSLFFSLALTSILAWAVGLRIHLYTLAGLAISFGLLIDNAIVMLDHWERERNRQVFLALLGASLTTVAALCLVFFLPKEEKENLMEFSWSIALSLAASLVVSLWATPALHSLLFEANRTTRKPKRPSRLHVKAFLFYGKSLAFLQRFRYWVYAGLLLLFGLPLFALPRQIEGNALYNHTLGSKIYQENVRPWLDVSTGGLLRVFALYVYEKSSYRKPEKTELFVQAEFPFGTTLTQADETLQMLERFLNTQKGIAQFNVSFSKEYAQIQITFTKASEKTGFPYRLKSQLVARTLDLDGTSWNVYGVGQAFSSGGTEKLPGFRVEMRGFQYDKLENEANKMAERLLRHKRIKEVNTNARLNYGEKSIPEFVLRPRAEDLRLAGISPAEFQETILEKRLKFHPDTYVEFKDKLYPLVLQDAEALRFSLHQLQHMPLHATKPFRVTGLATLQETKTLSAIRKEDRQYIRVLGWEYFGKEVFGQKYLDKIMKETQQALPPGFSAKQIEHRWFWEKAKRQYGLLAVLLVLIYGICAVLFESFRLPLVIVLLIPLSFLGIFYVFGIEEVYFDQGGYAAFVLLGGLTVNASIFVVHQFLREQKSKRQKNSSLKKIQKAVWKKAPAIWLTTLSTIGGLLPFLWGGQAEVFWFALAAGSMGGLVVSLVLVFFVLPLGLANYTRSSSSLIFNET